MKKNYLGSMMFAGCLVATSWLAKSVDTADDREIHREMLNVARISREQGANEERLKWFPVEKIEFHNNFDIRVFEKYKIHAQLRNDLLERAYDFGFEDGQLENIDMAFEEGVETGRMLGFDNSPLVYRLDRLEKEGILNL